MDVDLAAANRKRSGVLGGRSQGTHRQREEAKEGSWAGESLHLLADGDWLPLAFFSSSHRA